MMKNFMDAKFYEKLMQNFMDADLVSNWYRIIFCNFIMLNFMIY
jgi:hypothetical protein